MVTRQPGLAKLRASLRVALDDDRITSDALVTKQHADTMADELSTVLFESAAMQAEILVNGQPIAQGTWCPSPSCRFFEEEGTFELRHSGGDSARCPGCGCPKSEHLNVSIVERP